jgi:dienelactone hydrolase
MLRTLGTPVLAAIALGVACACASAPSGTDAAPDPDAAVEAPWEGMRARAAKLVRQGPAPLAPSSLTLPSAPDVVLERARVPAGDLALLAVVARPLTAPRTSDTPAEKLPGVVLFHGDFGLTSDQLEHAVTVARRGFVVLMPTLRGENGNGGAFELLRGEVEDARAAVRFLAAEPDVDVDRLYALGHSMGGGLATLLAIDGDVPLRLVASVNGVFAPSTFIAWHKEDPRRVPFDLSDPIELQVRALIPFAHQVKLPLVLYAGKSDATALTRAKTAYTRAIAAARPVELVELDGDHMSALAPALADFIQRIEKDAGITARPPAPAVARASRP